MSLTGLAATALAGVTGRAAVTRYYDGPISDHFDGTHFYDPHGAPPKGFVDLVLWPEFSDLDKALVAYLQLK